MYHSVVFRLALEPIGSSEQTRALRIVFQRLRFSVDLSNCSLIRNVFPKEEFELTVVHVWYSHLCALILNLRQIFEIPLYG